ncbi:glycosyl hydrolase [Paenibacillus glycanilyticus]|uniref:glycosyl hydrolase n=1 Tax=Paenibacillus glycanilyticus TaxID=126569 RepID=UPI001910F9F1|nr:glycosyl hydrolase [Paenibacillus glycanilyticus]
MTTARKKGWRGLRFILAMAFILALTVQPLAQTVHAADTVHHWKHYTNGVSYMNQGKIKLAIKEFELAVAQSEQAGYLRKLAEAYTLDNQFQKAADTYYREAKIHKAIGEKSGDLNTYFAVLAKADALNTEIDLYLEKDGASSASGSSQLAKFEPASGMYIGAYVEKDSGVEKQKDGKFDAFNKLAGKQHAVFFNYHKYGNPFPYHWAETVKEAGGAIQIALQPDDGLNAVKDDAYLRKFARDAKAAGVPVFLRFASEMNGSWVKWNGNPSLYIEKFRLVSKVMKEEAPNVAMVWSPAANPKQKIAAYYPGDDYVDWVGLSIYSVKYFNGNVKEPADQVNPLDSVDYTYKLYASRKPIMISEFGATHFSKAGNTSAVNFAITKMNMLYHGAKLKYPRVKSINWFSLNTLTDSYSAERSLNNFSLTESPALLASYGKMIQDPYYLSKVVSGSSSYTKTVSKFANQGTIGKPTTGVVWVKTYDPYIGKVVIKLDGAVVLTRQQYPYTFSIQPDKLKAGSHKIEVVVFDSKNREASHKSYTFKTT